MTIRFTYYGHAALGLNLDGVQLLVDPAFSDMPYDIGLAQSLAPDYICITHGHGTMWVMQWPLRNAVGRRLFLTLKFAVG